MIKLKAMNDLLALGESISNIHAQPGTIQANVIAMACIQYMDHSLRSNHWHATQVFQTTTMQLISATVKNTAKCYMLECYDIFNLF